ncbi:hypothetical protein yaldo0001_11490 [Yersinia aldovae ATCC 35236]|nr:hypothetical protein yaldo0001_11490 [Yersinia aldovae ATCC 35236]
MLIPMQKDNTYQDNISLWLVWHAHPFTHQVISAIMPYLFE